MKSSSEETTLALGAAMEGGFYAGRIILDGSPFGLVTAPKALGQLEASIWIARSKAVPDARSYCDGMANTRAMAEAGSKLAKQAFAVRIGGFDDWYLPSLDEIELCYRHLKPGVDKNWCFARCGINLNSLPPGSPYTPDSPVQTMADAFRAGGAEAFDQVAYWSSTQHVSVSDSGCAWGQGFVDGNQLIWDTDGKLPARVVRRFPL
jgi:hypothetical protein